MPSLSIITTVYDRADCLRSCIESVANLHFRDYEHIVVADHPPCEDLARLEDVVTSANDPRIAFCDLPERTNNLGISPAEFGIRKAVGDYVAFLDDDNAFLPSHFDALIDCLERSQDLGFAYSACLWNNEKILNDPVPSLGRIDLGQVVFRRSLFRSILDDALNYSTYEWDWHLLRDLMSRGVKFRFINQETFVFRLKSYPNYPPETPVERAERRIDELTATQVQLQTELASLKDENACLGVELMSQSARLSAQQSENASLTAKCAELVLDVAAARDEIHRLRSSTCWRMTSPLRSVLDRIRQINPKRSE